mgnify:CR=1 FL=1
MTFRNNSTSLHIFNEFYVYSPKTLVTGSKVPLFFKARLMFAFEYGLFVYATRGYLALYISIEPTRDL